MKTLSSDIQHISSGFLPYEFFVLNLTESTHLTFDRIKFGENRILSLNPFIFQSFSTASGIVRNS